MPAYSRNATFNELIRQLFNSEDWQKRAEAARKLGLLKDPRASNLLWRAIKSEKEYMVVNRIIEAMGRIGDAKITLSILNILKEELAKEEIDKFRIICIIESLTKLKDKRALSHIGSLLSSPDLELRTITENAFNTIEPNWREIIKKEKKEKTIEEIFKVKL
ncbi:MAG: HEAT repeat domain-containing protein [Promethearchaeota archaeon]